MCRQTRGRHSRRGGDVSWVPLRPRVGAAVLGAVALLIAGIGGAVQPYAFFRAYLTGYTFWLGLSLGCLALVFIQFLTGGAWGLLTRRIFEAGAACLPLLAVLFVPIVFALPALYPWINADAVAQNPALQH